MMTLHQLMREAKKEGYIFKCAYDLGGEADYRGTNIREAYEAMNACDCMWLTLLRKPNEDKTGPHPTAPPLKGGSLFFVPSLEKEEQIADYLADGGWIDKVLSGY